MVVNLLWEGTDETWLPIFVPYILIYNKYNKTTCVHGGRPVLARNLAPFSHPPHSTNSPFCLCSRSSHWGIFPAQTGNYFLFINDDYSNLATSFFAVFVRGFPHSQISMGGNYYFGTVPQLYTDTCYRPVWALYTNTIHQQVWEDFFFFSSAEGCCVVCGVSVREQKSLAKGHSACRRISSLSRGKRRGKPRYSWLCRSIYTAELIARICSLILRFDNDQ